MQHRMLSIYAQAVQLILHSIQVVCVIDLGFLTNYVKALGIRRPRVDVAMLTLPLRRYKYMHISRSLSLLHQLLSRLTSTSRL